MPTSKSRKGRIIARLKEKQRVALQRKSQLGLDKSSSLIHKAGKKSSNGWRKMIECLRCSLNDNTSAISPERDMERCEGNYELSRADIANGNNPKASSSEELCDMQFMMRHKTTTVNEANEFWLPLKDAKESNLSATIRTNQTEVQNTSHDGHFANTRWQSFPFSIIKALPDKVWRIINTLLGSFTTGNELIDLQNRVMLLEQEINKLKHAIEGQYADGHQPGKVCTSEIAGDAALPISTAAVQRPPPPPPPPPPPAPPPAPPPPPPLLQKGNTCVLKKKGKELKLACPESSRKGDSKNGLHITNDQLSKVKLRRVVDRDSMTKDTAIHGRQLVTLKDLHSIKLRKTSNRTKKIEEIPTIEERTPLRDVRNTKFLAGNKQNRTKSPKSSTPHFVYNLRKSLKKVDLARSPGGTPLVKMKRETGIGLTPLISAALKRKFEFLPGSGVDFVLYLHKADRALVNVNQDSFERSSEFQME